MAHGEFFFKNTSRQRAHTVWQVSDSRKYRRSVIIIILYKNDSFYNKLYVFTTNAKEKVGWWW